MIKCEGCPKEAKYIVYDQPHCTACMLDAVECRGYVEVRWIEDEPWLPNQSKRRIRRHPSFGVRWRKKVRRSLSKIHF
ncbi:hypothetical protein D5F53_29390 [Paenibacillus lautus]|uniref:Uncharacterized protein n=1 Tax=Paenibacillus lautus TaxID=1401 RepID=A0A385TXE3_PAELA|nr:hypothetical protein D5F53_29390 [Paenibacillus lautus]